MRTLVLLAFGATAGAGGVWLHAAPGSTVVVSTPATVSKRAESVAVSQPANLSGRPAAGYASGRVEAYRRAAAATSHAEIEVLIDSALSDPPSRLRDLEIEVLLARLAELDPREAVQFARSRDLETRYRLPLFEAWAGVDAEAAINEVANETPPARRRELALAVLDVLGGSADAYERIVGALPSADRTTFEIDALVVRARLDPLGAIEALLTANPRGMGSLARLRIAELAVRRDPQGAITQARLVPHSPSAAAFEAQVIEAWIRLDPDAAFDWIESLDSSGFPEQGTFLASLAASDPERLLGLAEALPSGLKSAAQRAAMQALGGRDPVAALAMLDSMPLPPADRSLMLQAIAETYGRQDPSAAQAWARGLPQDDRDAFGHVVRGIAEADFNLAADMVIAEVRNPRSTDADGASLAIRALAQSARGRDHAMTDFASRLLATGSEVADQNITQLVALWSIADAEGAADFAVANAEGIDTSAFSTLARKMAAGDPDRAIALAGQLPPDRRGGWIEGVARELAGSEPGQAKAFVDRFRGQAGYEEAYRSVVVRAARTDPAAAASMLDTAPDSDTAQSAAYAVARQWAHREPAAAAEWALGIAGDPARQTALNNVAVVWAATDAEATRRFVAGIAAGAARDTAIDGYLQAVAQRTDRLDTSMLDSYSTTAARERGASRAILQIARYDVSEARRLLDVHITDEAIRRATAERIAQAGSARPGANPPEPVPPR